MSSVESPKDNKLNVINKYILYVIIINMFHRFDYLLSGMQHGVIMGGSPWGLSLDEKIMPQYLGELGYKSHIVGKVNASQFILKFSN